MNLHGIPLERFLNGLHHSYRKALAKKLRSIIEHLSLSISENAVPSLEECLKFLGTSTMRLSLLLEFEKTALHASGKCFLQIKEIRELREQTRKQMVLLEDMIRAHLKDLINKKEVTDGSN